VAIEDSLAVFHVVSEVEVCSWVLKFDSILFDATSTFLNVVATTISIICIWSI
jgi:hypothetical protein